MNQLNDVYSVLFTHKEKCSYVICRKVEVIMLSKVNQSKDKEPMIYLIRII
jgi:hypothetical protein